MAVPARISLVTLGVTDLERSVAFYEAIGWRRSSASIPGRIAFFHAAGTVLTLYGWDDATVPAEGSGFRGVTLAVNCDGVEQVDEAVASFVAAGATLVKPPHHADWGGYTGYVADPDGHLIEVAHNPYFPIGDDGVTRLPE